MRGNLTTLKQLKENIFDKVIIDGLNAVHRYKWTMRRLTDSKGRPTGLFYGILNLCYNLRKQYGKDLPILFLWDSKDSNSIRRKINPKYKATRSAKPLEFWTMVNELQMLLSFYGVEQYYLENYEADDIANYFLQNNLNKKLLFISNDRDWQQLLIDNNKYIEVNNEKINKDYFEKTNFLLIEAFPLFKSIMGDSSDNIDCILNMKKLKVKMKKEEVIDKLKILLNKSNGDFEQLQYLQDNDFYKTLISYLLEREKEVKNNLKLIYFQKLNRKPREIKRIKDNERFYSVLKSYEMNKLLEKIKYE